MGKKKTKTARLTVTIPGDAPPSEFRVFRKGINKTSKGDFLFDDAAARAVMAAYRKAGVDVMIDLEHLSLDSESASYDPDAYGWCKLEIRNGELWATHVTWTEAGAERLQKKKSRYISPAFHYLTESGRITEIYNIAICAVPATHETPALVAASKRVGKDIGTLTIEVKKMEELKAIAKKLGLSEDSTLEEVLAAIETLQDGGGEEETETTEDEETEETTEEEDDAETTAEIRKLSPKAQAEFMAARAGNKALKERLAKLEKNHEASERASLIAANIDKLPKELEEWAQSKETTIESLRHYFKKAIPVRREKLNQPKKPAVKSRDEGGAAGDDEEVKLTKEDLRLCKQTGRSPEKFLEAKKALAKKRAEEKQMEEAD
jgi:phage I-like protein